MQSAIELIELAFVLMVLLINLLLVPVSFLVCRQIRQILNLPELTPEEEAQAREEHKWIFEES